MPERLLTITEAASRLGVHQQTLRSWSDKGLVPVVRMPSGHRRFELAALDRFRRGMGMETGDDRTNEADGAGGR